MRLAGDVPKAMTSFGRARLAKAAASRAVADGVDKSMSIRIKSPGADLLGNAVMAKACTWPQGQYQSPVK
jgi:hypothetical protein